MRKLRKLDKITHQKLMLETYLDFERQQSVNGEKNILELMREKLELAGAIQLGLFVACLSIFLNFIVVNLILHL